MDQEQPIVVSCSQTIRHVLPLGRRIAYSFGHVLNDLCASMWFSYMLIYLQSVLMFDSHVAGQLILLGQVADAISTPLVGLESDKRHNFKCCKYGQRKTWHLIGTFCVAFTFPFLFMDCIQCSNASQNAKFVYFAAFIAIFQFGWASTQVSHLSLIPDLTPISSERTELNVMRYAMTVSSNICVYSTMWLVLGVHSSKEDHIGPKDARVFEYVSLSMTGIGLLFSVVFHVFVKEHPPAIPLMNPETASIYSDDMDKPHLKWKDWFKQPQFYMVALLYMSARLYVNLSQVYVPLYIEKSLDLHKKNIAIIPLVIYVSSFLFSFFIKYSHSHFGNKISYFLGCLVALAACTWIYFGEGDSYRIYQIYAVAVLIGCGGSTLLIISISTTSDLIANSVSSGAFVFGCMSFTDKLSNGIAVILIQDLQYCSCARYYQEVLVFACGSAVILGLISLALLSKQNIGVRRNQDSIRRTSTRACSEVVDTDDCDPLLLDDDSVEYSYEDEKKLEECY